MILFQLTKQRISTLHQRTTTWNVNTLNQDNFIMYAYSIILYSRKNIWNGIAVNGRNSTKTQYLEQYIR